MKETFAPVEPRREKSPSKTNNQTQKPTKKHKITTDTNAKKLGQQIIIFFEKERIENEKLEKKRKN